MSSNKSAGGASASVGASSVVDLKSEGHAQAQVSAGAPGAPKQTFDSPPPTGSGKGIWKVEVTATERCPVHTEDRAYPDIVKTVLTKKQVYLFGAAVSFPIPLIRRVRTSGVPKCDCVKTVTGHHVSYFLDDEDAPLKMVPFSVPSMGMFSRLKIFVKQYSQFVQVYIFANTSTAVATTSVKDTSNTGRTIAATNATSAVNVVAGTTGTAAATTDYALGAQSASTSGTQAAAMTAISGNAYTITGTITNGSGSPIAYNEVGVVITANAETFLMCHDAPLSGGPFNVSAAGTLAITYTHTNA